MDQLLIEVSDEDGNPFWVETATPSGEQPQLAGTPEHRLLAKVEDLQTLIRQLGRVVTEALRGMTVDSAELEVGVKLGGEAGNTWFVAKVTGEATLKLKIVWSPAPG